jgi:hypothetical protein
MITGAETDPRMLICFPSTDHGCRHHELLIIIYYVIYIIYIILIIYYYYYYYNKNNNYHDDRENDNSCRRLIANHTTYGCPIFVLVIICMRSRESSLFILRLFSLGNLKSHAKSRVMDDNTGYNNSGDWIDKDLVQRGHSNILNKHASYYEQDGRTLDVLFDLWNDVPIFVIQSLYNKS